MAQSSAQLIIDRPERYAKQLASHISHRTQVATENGVSKVVFGFGATGTIATTSEAVLLSAESDDLEALARAQDVLGRHLLKFAKLEDQTLQWTNS